MTRIFNRLILSIILSTFVFFLKINAQPLPADFPQNVLDIVNKPAPDFYFMAYRAKIQEYWSQIWIFDNDSNLAKGARANQRGYNFNMITKELYSYTKTTYRLLLSKCMNVYP